MSLAVAVLPDAGAPQVGLTITGLAPSTQSVLSVEVTWDGGETWHGVRGADHITAIGSIFVRDHVPPLNTQATYRLVVHSGDKTPEDQASITVPSASAWLQDPLAPRSAVEVRADMDGSGVLLTAGSLAGATWAQPVDLATPIGADLPVASIGRRLLAGSVPLIVSYQVAADAGALRRLLLSSGQLVLRGADGAMVEPVAHLVVGDVTETRLGVPGAQVSTWSLAVSQVRPVSMQIVVPWWTYDQVKAMWAGSTYDEVKLARPGATYLDWAASPEPV